MAYMTYKGYSMFASPMNTIGYSWMALFYTGCLLIAVSAGGRRQHLLCNRLLAGLSTIAYCAYLIHMPLIYAGQNLVAHLNYPHNATSLLGGIVGVAATLALATVSWKFMEKPLLRRGRSYTY
jgi:peptidoglycan/LPS O-acetylase OafA/YrhL